MRPTLLAVFIALIPLPLLAQGPAVSATGVKVNVAAGYSYLNLSVPSGNHVGLNGADLSFGVDCCHSRFGGRLDLSYARAGNVFGSDHHADVLSYLAGPVFYPYRGPRTSAYVEALFGGARVTAPIPDGAGGVLFGGYANKFAWAAGAGAEFRLPRVHTVNLHSFAVRVGADLLHTAYFNSSKAITGENNLRVVTCIVYNFGHPRD